MPPRPDKPFTSAIWTVKEGKGTEFVNAWLEFARWTKEHFPGADMAYLLQDQERPEVYLTMGPWKDMEDIDRWRSSPEFKRFFVKAKELCSDIRPMTLNLVAIAT